MGFLTSLAAAVMGNVIAYYVIKWLDGSRKNGNEPEQRSKN